MGLRVVSKQNAKAVEFILATRLVPDDAHQRNAVVIVVVASLVD